VFGVVTDLGWEVSQLVEEEVPAGLPLRSKECPSVIENALGFIARDLCPSVLPSVQLQKER